MGDERLHEVTQSPTSLRDHLIKKSREAKLFYVVFNTLISSSKISGGDRISIELFRRLTGHYKVQILTPYSGRSLCIQSGLEARYDLIKSRYDLEHRPFYNPLEVAVVYAVRAIRAALLIRAKDLPENSLLYSCSDLLPDTVPAFVARSLGKRKLIWIASIFLIAPPPWKQYEGNANSKNSLSIGNLLYFFSQTFSLLLIRKSADAVVVLNDDDRRILISRGISSKKILTISGGVDIAKIQSASSNFLYDGCFVARFHPQKGVFDLLRVWSKVCKAIPYAKLAIIGHGDPWWTKKVVREIEHLGLAKNCEIMGFLQESERNKILRASRVFLFPSYNESFALSILEAMASGLPVIAYDLQVYRNVYPLGLLSVRLGDIDGFAQCVIDLLLNEEKRRTVGDEAKQTAQQYDWNLVADRFMTRIESLRIN